MVVSAAPCWKLARNDSTAPLRVMTQTQANPTCSHSTLACVTFCAVWCCPPDASTDRFASQCKKHADVFLASAHGKIAPAVMHSSTSWSSAPSVLSKSVRRLHRLSFAHTHTHRQSVIDCVFVCLLDLRRSYVRRLAHRVGLQVAAWCQTGTHFVRASVHRFPHALTFGWPTLMWYTHVPPSVMSLASIGDPGVRPQGWRMLRGTPRACMSCARVHALAFCVSLVRVDTLCGYTHVVRLALRTVVTYMHNAHANAASASLYAMGVALRQCMAIDDLLVFVLCRPPLLRIVPTAPS
jgi:hypothetical protein